MEPECCRLCLKTDSTLNSVASQELPSSEHGGKISLGTLIQQYISINLNFITSEARICEMCFTHVKEWHLFRESCLEIDRKLQKQHIKFEEVITAESYDLHSIEFNSINEISSKTLKDVEEDRFADNLEEELRQCYPESGISKGASSDLNTPNSRREKTRRKTRTSYISKATRGRTKNTIHEVNRSKPVQHEQASRKQRVLPKICTICGMARTDMAAHMRWHNNERPYQCPHCPKIFVNSSNLKNHINLHTREKMYKCDLCDKEFPSSTGRSKHRETHTTERTHLCAICGKSFKYRASLARHKIIHFEEPKVKCTVCNMMFLTKTRLTKHVLVHLDKKPFSCEICGRAFNRKDNLKTHKRTHTTADVLPNKSNSVTSNPPSG
ncbi:zinc finger protein 724-like [Anopheles nili]|uniref:zinc finger protein 724-like n=1 Tax=Anopheles nili TaxID=185578 RepID=UPI00237BCE70|nr:zinc finger protein 724-like [Anopheles nili]